MADLEAVIALHKEEHRTVPGQTKFTPSESKDIDWAVEVFHGLGVHGATRSSFIRASVLDTVQALKEEFGK